MVGDEGIERFIRTDAGRVLLNTKKNFNIRRKMVESLSYPTLHDAFHGMNNFRYSEFYFFLNTAEIVGFWTGLSHKHLFLEEKAGLEQIPTAVPRIIRYGYITSRSGHDSHYSLDQIHSELAKANANTFDSSIDKRVQELPSFIKMMILTDLLSPYTHSDSEDRMRAGYHDPNVDGRNSALYVTRIMGHVKNTFQTLVDKYQVQVQSQTEFPLLS